MLFPHTDSCLKHSLMATLAVLFGLLALVVPGKSIPSLLQLWQIESRVAEVSTKWLPSVIGAYEISAAVAQVRINQFRSAAASTDSGMLTANRRLYEVAQEHLTQTRHRYERPISAPKEWAFYTGLLRFWYAYLVPSRRLLGMVVAGRLPIAVSELNHPDMLRLYTELREVRPRRVAFNPDSARVDVDASISSAQTATLEASIAEALALVAALEAMLFGHLRRSRPTSRMTDGLRCLAECNIVLEVHCIERRDDIGTMAGAVQVFKNGRIRARRLEEEMRLAGAEARRKGAMCEMADSFELSISGIIGTVTSSATKLQATDQSMARTVTETACHSTTVVADSEEAVANTDTVAAAGDELDSSVRKISREVDGSAKLAKQAVGEPAQTAVLVQEMSAAVAKTGDVVTLITTIAGQPTLLSLDAKVQVARVGEAGRGFAVVASEIIELAAQTAQATEEVPGQIARAQGSTGQEVQGIGSIAARIQEIRTVATIIAAGIEEHGVATQEIVRNVGQAAAGTGDVIGTIANLAHTDKTMGAAAKQVFGAASQMTRQTEDLNAVSHYLSTVRVA